MAESIRTRNRAFRAAYERGRQAGNAGMPAEANPYPDHRADSGCITWSRAFRKYWRRGWEVGRAEWKAGRERRKPGLMRPHFWEDEEPEPGEEIEAEEPSDG